MILESLDSGVVSERSPAVPGQGGAGAVAATLHAYGAALHAGAAPAVVA